MTAAAVKMPRRSTRAEEPEWLVWLLVAVLLGIGLLVRTAILNRTTTFSQAGVSVQYPAAWIALDNEGPNELFSAGEPFDSGLFPARIAVLQAPVSSVNKNMESLGDLALWWSDRGTRDLLGYKVLNIEPVKVRGQDAVRIDYAYVAEPALASPNSIPIVAHGADILVRQGESVTVVRLLADADAFEGLGGTWDRIVGSLEVK